MPEIQYVDFIPQVLEAEVPYSTLSLIGSSGGPKYESFSVIVENANRWLESHRGVCVVHVELLDVAGVYSCGGFQADRPRKLVLKDCSPVATAAFLKIIRLWYTSSDGDIVSQLSYAHVVPARLETNPRAFNPKFENLRESLKAFNDRLNAGDINVEGRLLCAHSSTFRFNSRHCSLDPDRCFWMVDDVSEVHICFYFTVFFVKSMECSLSRLDDQEICYEDFASKVTVKSRKRKKKSVCTVENVSGLMERIRLWLAHTNARLVNIQTIDHSAYYQSSIDNPGYEDKSLTNPHYRSSLSSLQRCSKVLRVYYCKRASADGLLSPAVKPGQIFHKSFVMKCKPVPLSRVNLGQPNADIHLQLEPRLVQEVNSSLDSSDTLSRLAQFRAEMKTDSYAHGLIAQVEAALDTILVTLETLKLGVDNKRYRSSAADDTHFISKSTVDSGAVYGVRLYVLQCEQSVSNYIDSKSVPRFVGNLRNSQCVIS